MFLAFRHPTALAALLVCLAAQSTLAESPRPGNEMMNSLEMKLVYVSAGEFEMGSPETEKDRKIGETRRRVRLTRGFYMGACEVTVGQFREFVRQSRYQTDAETDGKGGIGWDQRKFAQRPEYTWKNVGFDQSEKHPVVNVSWNDSKAFCDWLGARERRNYRLPTEAEWEYACRAGTTTAYASGDDPEALARLGNVADSTWRGKPTGPKWIEASDGHFFTAPVGAFQPNAFGLFDMHGNAWEWCADWYKGGSESAVDPTGPRNGTSRVMRGGSWLSFPSHCRSAYRGLDSPNARDFHYGFRVVCTN